MYAYETGFHGLVVVIHHFGVGPLRLNCFGLFASHLLLS
jgi:hypothetical protein